MINTIQVNKNSLRFIMLSYDIILPVGNEFMVNRIVIKIYRNSKEFTGIDYTKMQNLLESISSVFIRSIYIETLHIKNGKMSKLRKLSNVCMHSS